MYTHVHVLVIASVHRDHLEIDRCNLFAHAYICTHVHTYACIRMNMHACAAVHMYVRVRVYGDLSRGMTRSRAPAGLGTGEGLRPRAHIAFIWDLQRIRTRVYAMSRAPWLPAHLQTRASVGSERRKRHLDTYVFLFVLESAPTVTM